MLIITALYIIQIQLEPLKHNHSYISNTEWTVLYWPVGKYIEKQIIIIRVTIY